MKLQLGHHPAGLAAIGPGDRAETRRLRNGAMNSPWKTRDFAMKNQDFTGISLDFMRKSTGK